MGRLEVSLTSYDPGAAVAALRFSPATVGFFFIDGTQKQNAVQTVTEGGVGLVSYTLALFGNTSGAIPAGATAAQVEAAIEALPGVGVGNAPTTGVASGPYTVTFAGAAGNQAVPLMVAAPTGGTGTVTVLTTVSGGAGRRHVLSLQPQRYGESWTVSRVTIQNNSTQNVPSVSIYRGVIGLSSLIDQTQNGQADTDDLNSPLHLFQGEPIIITFEGCDVPAANGIVTSSVYLGGESNR